MSPIEIQLEAVLNSADTGLSLAARVATHVRAGETVFLDFAKTERMTSSFANAFVMTLMNEWSLDHLREHVQMMHRNERVERAISDSVRRFNDGIRLSTQAAASCLIS
jgi:hypothetical protein